MISERLELQMPLTLDPIASLVRQISIASAPTDGSMASLSARLSLSGSLAESEDSVNFFAAQPVYSTNGEGASEGALMYGGS